MVDHFTAFVDRISADLDAVPVGADALASQAHLSRFHFDRVVAAIGGESPTRFRARIMLERAAYAMLTTDANLIDIAVVAGFGSHEAFTRAFRREYGQAPSLWRKHPGSFRIDAPNDVHFHPPGGLRLPGRHRMDSVDLTLEMVRHHVWLLERMVDKAGNLTDAELDHPLSSSVDGIDGDSARWTLSRLVGQLAMWNAAVADRTYDFGVERNEPLSSIRDRLSTAGPEFVSNASTYSHGARFDETFVDAFDQQPRVLSYGAMIAHVLAFAAHHRLLVLDRLRSCGVPDLGFGDPKDWFDRTMA